MSPRREAVRSGPALALLIASLVLANGCGRKKDFDRGDELEAAVLGGGGGGRVQGSQVLQPGSSSGGGGGSPIIVRRTVRVPKPRPVFEIVPVAQIITATSGLPDYPAHHLPFTGAAVAIGQPVTDGQTPFHFLFDYPANNYQFTEAHLVMDTARDNSDTEGIFVDGVFSGRPPTDMVNLASPRVTNHIWAGNGVNPANTYYLDWSLAHYKVATRNTFDLRLADLLTPTALTENDAVKDGRLDVVTGDDSPVYQAFLVLRGLTIAGEALSCVDSDLYTFTNVYLHNDGNTTGEAFFSGSVVAPNTAWGAAVGAHAAAELNFDPALPKVRTANITLTKANLVMQVKRSASGRAALIVNGRGVAEPGFDRATATAAVEVWDEGAVAAWQSYLAAIPTNGSTASTTLDLLALFGAETVRGLLAQGKLNVSVAGNLVPRAGAASTNRTYGVQVTGPELALEGRYFTEVCDVPHNPDSPLTEAGFVEPPIEYEEIVIEEVVQPGQTPPPGSDPGGGVVLNDGASPLINSLQVQEITSTSATVLWLTDEGATSQVRYGVGNTASATAENSAMKTFHQVRLTGLLPYKYYSIQAVSKDKYGNESVSQTLVFTTLR